MVGFIVGIIGLIVITFLVFLFKDSDEDKARKENLKQVMHLQVIAEDKVKSMLKDSGSAKFKNQIGPCGYVNAKNSFGGYVGYKRYIVYKGMHALEDTNVTTEQMNELWLKACK